MAIAFVHQYLREADARVEATPVGFTARSDAK
jgi:hypothetical protein